MSTKKSQSKVGRPRNQNLEAAFLNATVKVIGDKGYRDLTLSDVAEEAGSSRPALYRRWSSKQGLVVDTLSMLFKEAIPEVPDTGSPQVDVATMLKGFTALLRKNNGYLVLVNLIPELRRDNELGNLFKKIEIGRRLFLVKAILRGQSRDLIDPALDIDLAIDRMLGAIYFRLIFRDGIPPDEVIDEIARATLPPSEPFCSGTNRT
ncbi:TetR/AcrR family transcriptional regulator [Roseibium sediminicola]|uniref:TetR/AcrR family transcriptional regulator n=1 Tax=Roseibium sediminicola TaxID=2933272 RepID=A0ABT0H2M1_9HYPH|nr:TetR/AcrR family transcriptional regulator [Roseibium sp. CAU 1639]MCK7615720.1 TetR/AcrR family transcriptional regulator [Roseibium sp. CAU 1639]